MMIKKNLIKGNIWTGTAAEVPAIPAAANLLLTNSSGVLTVTYDYSNSAPLVESNKPPSIDQVIIISDASYSVGDTLTASTTNFMTYDNSNEASFGYTWYKATSIQGSGLTVIPAANDSSTYTITSGEIGKFVYVDVVPKQDGSGINLIGSSVNSFYTDSISDVLPTVYQTINPRNLFLNGRWDPSEGASGEWINSGTDAGVWEGSIGGIPTKGANDEAHFDGTQAILGNLGTGYPSTSGWSVWIKFKADSGGEIKYLFELGNNRTLETLSGRQLRISSTTGMQTTEQITYGVNYNLIATFEHYGSIVMRVEEDDGTVFVDDVSGNWNNNEPAAGVTYLGQKLEQSNYWIGSISEFGYSSGVLDPSIKVDLMTRLKGITL